jgi:adenylate cyclase
LNVDAVVEGTVMRSGGRVRITAQLIEASIDRHLWARSYEDEGQNVLAVQYEISKAIAQQVRLVLTPRGHIRTGIDKRLDPEAYESYLRGEYWLNRFTPESIQQATAYFQHAIDKDPEYAPAYAKLSGCYRMLANMGVAPADATNRKANALITKALELEPYFAPAHAGKGWGLLMYDLDFAAAGAEFKLAVDLDPNSPEGHEGLSDYYATIGRVQDAVQEAERTRELDPLASIVNNNLCQKLTFARRYDEALAQCKANTDLDSNSARSLWIVGDVYAAKGMESEALSSFLQALQRVGASSRMIAAAEGGARTGGLRGYWRALSRDVPENLEKGTLGPFDAAQIYAYSGDADRAMHWLEKAVEKRSFGVTYLGVDPTFDSLRSDPRFVSLLRRIALPQAQSVH